MAKKKTIEATALEQENERLKGEIEILQTQIKEFNSTANQPKKLKAPGAAKASVGRAPDPDRKWWEGGTLHNVTLGAWAAQGYSPNAIGNRLATCADYLFLFRSQPELYKHQIEFDGNMDLFLVRYASPLVIHIGYLANDPELADMDSPTAILTAAEHLGFIKHNPIREQIDYKRSQAIAQGMLASEEVSQDIKDSLTGDSPMQRGIRKAKEAAHTDCENDPKEPLNESTPDS